MAGSEETSKKLDTEELQQSAPEPIGTEGAAEAEAPAPPKPARPLSPFAEKQLILTEAFPSIEVNVVRAILIAAQGQLDPAFNALLSLTDPAYEVDESQFETVSQPPPRSAAPPRGQQQRTQQRQRSQMEEDERLAQMLADEERGIASGQRRTRGGYPGQEPVDDRSFFDDDLPQIKETFTKGFNETKDKVNSWLGNFRKNMAGETTDTPPAGSRSGMSDGAGSYQPNRTSRARFYDGEPDQIDFQGIRLNDNDEPAPPALPARRSGGGSAGNNDHEDDLYSKPSDESSAAAARKTEATKKSIPLKSTDAGKSEAEDSFLIADSDDEETGKKGNAK